jgi:KaiC/GvpD/RAD55 family RecA-like ATPase
LQKASPSEVKFKMVVNMAGKGGKHKVKKSPKIAAKKPKREIVVKHELAGEGLKVMPTGIASLDGPIGGGFPAGSLVVLIGEVGSGNSEFAMTSSVMLAATKSGVINPPSGNNIVLPKEIWWVTFIRPQSDLMDEMSLSFDSDLYELFNKQSNFKDLSEGYFATSSVPLEWVSERLAGKRKEEVLESFGSTLAGVYRLSEKPSSRPKGILTSLADFLTEHGPNNLVILHTLTDLAMLYSESDARWYEFMMFLRGLQRATKKWGGLIYATLDAELLGKHREQEIASCVDGVLTFEWIQAGVAERRRTLYLKKFRRLPSSHGGGGAMRFNVSITPSVGVQVAKPELIEGLKGA